MQRMNRGRLGAWAAIVLTVFLLGVLVGRCSAPVADGEVTAGSAATPPAADPAPVVPATPTPTAAAPTAPEPTATEDPVPLPTGEPPATDEPQDAVHVVAAGETLTGIAEATYGDPFCFDELAAANGLDPQAGLAIGMELALPELDAPCT